MGNQLVGIAPSQILPVEQYLTDHHDLRFEISLGSTRFFKVARAKSQEGHIVVKVFAIQDPSLPLNAHREKLENIKKTLALAPNCLPFQRIQLTDKAALIMREFVKSSLYDRISTRPFLSLLEKKWITFQVLYSLYQCHKLGVCHGDIKLENIMLTSWNWVLLTDFASFKPTFLPEDNPADYNYFFDTSRRRLCYVAPERFVKTLGMDNFTKIASGEDKLGGGLLLNESPCRAGDLVPSMDIFSAGCALVELWNDGTPAWDLQGLLAYRSSDAPHSIKLPKHCDPRLVDLLTSMTQKNPQLRKSAEVYLDDERDKLFPSYFYNFLQPYMQIFSRQPGHPTDDKISTMHSDISGIIDMFVNVNGNDADKPDSGAEIEMDFAEHNANEKIKNSLKFRTIDASKRVNICDFKFDPNLYKNRNLNNPDCEVLVIITSLVTSCIRGLLHCTSKLKSLEILLQLAKYVSAENILDRILPYLLYLTHDPLPRVRVGALNTLTKCLYMIDDLPKSDINVFPEYIFVDIARLATDPAVSVRVAYANNIAILAETALRFLDQTQNLDNPKEAAKINYEAELTTLHGLVRQTVSSLLTDSQTIVRRVFIESGITKLCVFFGKQKANDVLLSHMITFLNDKEDTALRGSFFDCIVGVAAYVGWHCSHILVPLLQQGLTDPSEFITAKSLRATTSLAELGLIQKPSLCKLIAETVCYLSHPNLWIRHETCGLISCVARLLNPIDVNCKILPLVWPYLNYQLTQIEKTELLLESLKPAIPRPIFDSVIRYKDINQLLQTLRERKIARTKVKQGTVPHDCEMGVPLTNLFKRLDCDGLTEQIESQILKMSAHLIEMQGSKVPANSTNYSSELPGKLSISGFSCISRMVPLDSAPADGSTSHNSQIGSKDPFKKPYKPQQPIAETQSHMNSEWRHMFGDNKNPNESSLNRDLNENMANLNMIPQTHNLTNTFPSTSYCAGSNAGSQYTLRSPSPNPLESINSEMSLIADVGCQERSFVHCSEAPCHQDLKTLTRRQQMKYARTLRSRECAIESCGTNLPPQNWKPGNALMAQLHEHRGPINRLVNLSLGTNHKSYSTNGLFGSCSNDGTVRLWDLAKMEGVNIVNKSKSMYNRGAGPIIAMTPCEDNLSFAAAAHDSVFVLRLDIGSSKMHLSEGRQLDMSEDGGVVDVVCNTQYTGGDNIIVFSTLYGGIIGWDLRAQGHAWKLQGDLKHGVYTCMYASGSEWLAVGTSRGNISAWDLRFNLPITTLTHPKESRIRNIKPHPKEDSFIICTTLNEANIWSLESAQRQGVLWPSDKPPLTYTVPSSHQINALYTGIVDNTSFVLTAGSDQRVRYWNLDHPESSSILINDQFVSNKSSVTYRSRLIDATSVIQEVAAAPTPTMSSHIEEQASKCVPEPRGVHHTSSITDLTIVQAKKCYWLSASADGIINVWK